MRCQSVLASLLLGFLAVHATAAPLHIEVGNWLLQPNSPNQQIQIYASGGDGIYELDIFVQLGFGDVVAPPGQPKITNVDLLTGTIFEGHTLPPTVFGDFEQYWSVVAFADGPYSFPDHSLIATITISTIGVNKSTAIPLILSSNNIETAGSSYWNESGYHEFIVTDGSITSVPEPSSLAILGAALVGLIAVAIRRNRR